MTLQKSIKTTLIAALILCSYLMGSAQEVRVKPNNAAEQHVMIDVPGNNQNTFIGESSGLNTSTGIQNTFNGAAAGRDNTLGQFNTIMGSYSGPVLTTGNANTLMGQAAGNLLTTGSNNTMIGRNAGAGNLTGSGNVFLGHGAGQLETSSNRLYIANSAGSLSDALIYGDFSSKFLRFNATTGINKFYSGTTFNIQSNPSDFLVFQVEEDDGTDILQIAKDGYLGVNSLDGDVTLNLKSRTFQDYIFNAENTVGLDKFFIKSTGETYIADELGIGKEEPTEKLHILDGDAPTILIQSDGTNEESGRVSMRQSDGSGSDILYDGIEDVFAIESFTSGISGGKKFTVDLDGNVGIGVDNSTERLHIVDGDKPTILIESDGNDEESGRVSMRQSNGSGADILYDGTNSEDAFAIETFAGGTSKGKKMTIDLDGHVGITERYFDTRFNIKSIAGDTYAFNVEDDSGTSRLSVTPDGHVGINASFYDVGLNVRSIAGDYHAFNVEDDSGTNRLTVTPDGHVGINALYPDAALNVKSNVGDVYALAVADENGVYRLLVNQDGHVGINQISPNVALHVQSIADDIYALYVADDSGNDRFSVSTEGHVGINKVFNNITTNIRAISGDTKIFQLENSSGTNRFSIEPNGDGWMAGSLTQNSDSRLKRDIQEIDDAKERMSTLNGYRYYWKDKDRSQKRKIGVIAQEVQAVFPELVSEDDEGILSVNYSGLSAILIQVVNEQEKEIGQLKDVVNEQKKEIGQLKDVVNEMHKNQDVQNEKYTELQNQMNKFNKLLSSISALENVLSEQ